MIAITTAVEHMTKAVCNNCCYNKDNHRRAMLMITLVGSPMTIVQLIEIAMEAFAMMIMSMIAYQ